MGDVQADFFGPGGEELVVNGTGVAVADGVEVEAGDGEHTDRGAGEPGFGGFANVVGFDVGFLDGDVQPGGELDTGLAGDAPEDVVGFGG